MRRRIHKSRADCQGFTLMELLLVLALVVMAGAFAWPSVQHAYEGIRLKKAAEQVMSAFGHARVQAMSTGVPQVFRFNSGTGQYTLMAMQDDSQGLDSDASGLAGSGEASQAGVSGSSTSDSNASNNAGATPSTGAGSSSSSGAASCDHWLPDGYVFTKGQRVLDARAAAAESELGSDSSGTDSGSSDDSPPILFYPDGTTSEAVVSVANKEGRSIAVTLRGLTGIARMGAATSAGSTQ